MSLMDEYQRAMAQLRADVNDVVHNDMRDGIAVAMVDSARTRVYGVYNPTYYKRRWTLTDPSHYVFHTDGDMSIEVESPIVGNSNYAPPVSEGWNPGYISNIIESGDGYPWFSGNNRGNGIFPVSAEGFSMGQRPYMTEGMKDYVDKGNANADLADGLRARGYIVE